MHPTLQLLERHQNELQSQLVHWFDLPEPTHLTKPSDKQFNSLWSQNNDAQLDTESWPTSTLNILFYPKAKDRLEWWLRQLESTLTNQKKVWVVGENNGGIKSLGKRVKQHYHCTKVDSARHCGLYELTLIEPGKPINEMKSFTLGDSVFYALPGVFSAGRLDKGTDVLLGALPEVKGNILEFGSGCGVLTTQLAHQSNVTSVDAVEIDLLSVRSSQHSFVKNGVAEKANVIWSDGTRSLAEKQYDAIVTNPPFHQGIKTEYGPTQAFFLEAHKWLKTGGKLIWVANDFLNYQQFLGEHFNHINCVEHSKGFKVFSANRTTGS